MIKIDANLIFTVINLLIWYYIIRRFLFKPINTIISKREESIASKYGEADELKKQAQEEKDKCVHMQEEIDAGRAKAMEQAQEEAREEYQNILDAANKKADSIIESAKKEAEREKQKIITKADLELRAMFMDAAMKSMQANQNDSALYDEFLTKAGEEKHAEH